MFGGYSNNDYSDFDILKVSNSNGVVQEQRVQANEIDLNEKSVIILCGNNTRSLGRAEYYARLCRNWVDKRVQKNNFSTYSIFYPNTQPLFDTYSFLLDYHKLTTELFNKIIFRDGQILSTNEIKQNLSNITFFGHSAGGYVMNQIMQNLKDLLSNCNFPPDEIDEIYGSIVFLAYSPYSLVKAPIKSVYITPIYDSLGSLKLAYNETKKNNYKCSHSFDIDNLKPKTVAFANNYKKAICNSDVLYFANKNSIIATPNLLYYDGKKEDHNFAGVINYQRQNPNQTQAGKFTTLFMNKAFNYCINTKRENLDMLKLFKRVIAQENAYTTQTESEKEI